MMKKLPRAPKHLKPITRKWFASVVSEFDLEDHHVRLLTLACEAWDRCEQAREAINAEGICVKGRFGPRPHPALNVEKDSRIAFARLLRELALDVEQPDSRPPGIGR